MLVLLLFCFRLVRALSMWCRRRLQGPNTLNKDPEATVVTDDLTDACGPGFISRVRGAISPRISPAAGRTGQAPPPSGTEFGGLLMDSADVDKLLRRMALLRDQSSGRFPPPSPSLDFFWLYS